MFKMIYVIYHICYISYMVTEICFFQLLREILTYLNMAVTRLDPKTGDVGARLQVFRHIGENSPQAPYLMGKSMVSCRFSLKPIH